MKREASINEQISGIERKCFDSGLLGNMIQRSIILFKYRGRL